MAVNIDQYNRRWSIKNKKKTGVQPICNSKQNKEILSVTGLENQNTNPIEYRNRCKRKRLQRETGEIELRSNYDFTNVEIVDCNCKTVKIPSETAFCAARSAERTLQTSQITEKQMSTANLKAAELLFYVTP